MAVVLEKNWREGLLLSHGASWMQANVYLVDQDDRKVVVKDFGHAPVGVRYLVCRCIVKREIRALQQLDGSGITPRYLGSLGDYAYAMEYIDGENFRFKQHINSVDDLLALDRAVKRMHEMGVAHNDLHAKNIIVGSNGQYYFIDFASSFFKSFKKGIWPTIKNKLFLFFASADRSKISFLKRKKYASLLTKEDQRFLSIKKNLSVLTKVWKKLINEPFLRKRTWQKRKAWFVSLWKSNRKDRG